MGCNHITARLKKSCSLQNDHMIFTFVNFESRTEEKWIQSSLSHVQRITFSRAPTLWALFFFTNKLARRLQMLCFSRILQRALSWMVNGLEREWKKNQKILVVLSRYRTWSIVFNDPEVKNDENNFSIKCTKREPLSYIPRTVLLQWWKT